MTCVILLSTVVEVMIANNFTFQLSAKGAILIAEKLAKCVLSY